MILTGFDMYLLVSSAVAFKWGGSPERMAATAMLIAGVASKIAYENLGVGFTDLSPLMLSIDVSLVIALLTIVLKANRLWPMLMAALHLCTLFGHVARLVDLRMEPLAYYILLGKWSWAMIAILPAATFRHQLRLRKFGEDRPWSRI